MVLDRSLLTSGVELKVTLCIVLYWIEYQRICVYKKDTRIQQWWKRKHATYIEWNLFRVHTHTYTCVCIHRNTRFRHFISFRFTIFTYNIQKHCAFVDIVLILLFSLSLFLGFPENFEDVALSFIYWSFFACCRR